MGDNAKCVHGVRYSEVCDHCERNYQPMLVNPPRSNAEMASQLIAFGEVLVVPRELVAMHEPGYCPHDVALFMRCEDCLALYDDKEPSAWNEPTVEVDLSEIFPYMLTRPDGSIQGIMDQELVRKELIKLEQSGASLVIEPGADGQTTIQAWRGGKPIAVITKRRAS